LRAVAIAGEQPELAVSGIGSWSLSRRVRAVRAGTASDPPSPREPRLDQEYVAVRSDDGATYEPLTGDRLPVDAAEVILTTAMGGG
jgi:hypothetical protein